MGHLDCLDKMFTEDKSTDSGMMWLMFDSAVYRSVALDKFFNLSDSLSVEYYLIGEFVK